MECHSVPGCHGVQVPWPLPWQLWHCAVSPFRAGAGVPLAPNICISDCSGGVYAGVVTSRQHTFSHALSNGLTFNPQTGLIFLVFWVSTKTFPNCCLNILRDAACCGRRGAK